MTRSSRLATIAALSMLASANYLLPALGPGMPTSQRRPRSAPDENDKERLRAAEGKRAKRASARQMARQ